MGLLPCTSSAERTDRRPKRRTYFALICDDGRANGEFLAAHLSGNQWRQPPDELQPWGGDVVGCPCEGTKGVRSGKSLSGRKTGHHGKDVGTLVGRTCRPA